MNQTRTGPKGEKAKANPHQLETLEAEQTLGMNINLNHRNSIPYLFSFSSSSSKERDGFTQAPKTALSERAQVWQREGLA